MSATTSPPPGSPCGAERCFVCKGPFHPATGGYHPNGMGGLTPFCGACERDLLRWMIGHIKSVKKRVKVDGKTVVLRFYDYAHPPLETTDAQEDAQEAHQDEEG